jgi:amino acid permease
MFKRLWTFSTELWETIVLIMIGIVVLASTEPRTWVGQVLAGVLAAILILLCVINFIEWMRRDHQHH